MAKLGTAHEGVAHRMIRELYTQATQERPKSFKVSVQYVQVYLEHVYDLLDPDAGSRRSATSSSPKGGPHSKAIEPKETTNMGPSQMVDAVVTASLHTLPLAPIRSGSNGMLIVRLRRSPSDRADHS